MDSNPTISQLKKFVVWAQEECARIDQMPDSAERTQALQVLLVRVVHFEEEIEPEIKQKLFSEVTDGN